jgi:4-hydroxy-4-methyl-2-oxoglutarate aldolase
MASKTVVITKFARTTAQQLAELKAFGVATVHDAQDRTGLLAPYMRPIYPGAKIAGSAVTVLSHPGDNIMMHVAASVCQPGDVIVVALTAPNTDSMLGDLLATSFRARGAVGAVIDAGVRDIAELASMKFPVWSKNISAKCCVKETLGSVNVPVVCAGALIHPGDAIIADDDGVVVVPRATVEEVIAAAKLKEERDATQRTRLAAGELALDMNNMREKLVKKGLVFDQEGA